MIVLISDGRANVPLAVSTGEAAADEAAGAAGAAGAAPPAPAALGPDGKPLPPAKKSDAEKKEERAKLKEEV